MRYPIGCKPSWTHSTRGVHLQPNAYHTWWMRDSDRYVGTYWTDLLNDMHLTWVVMITDGDSCLEQIIVPGWGETTPVEFLLDHGIVPIVRDGTDLLPYSFSNTETVKELVAVYSLYGLKPIVLVANEPWDSREWKDNEAPKKTPENIQWVSNLLANRMMTVYNEGACPGFPDGPSYSYNPFEYLAPSIIDLFQQGLACYAGHHYGKGRPIDWPYDITTQTGYEKIENGHYLTLTESDITDYLDDFAGDPQWREETAEQINDLRFDPNWLSPGKTAVEDDVCFLGYERVLYYASQVGINDLSICLTEGGWVPRDRAGSIEIDYRWPHTTPKMVAKKTLAMFEVDSPFFAICPWLLATEDMGATGWFYDAWHTWAFEDKYGRCKPVIDALINNPPSPPQPIDVEAAKGKFYEMLRNLGENV